MKYKIPKQGITEYYFNYLKFLTGGQISDDILRKTESIEIKGDNISLYFRAKINTKNWKWILGTNK